MTAQPVHVLASTPIGRRLYDLAQALAWLASPCMVWHSRRDGQIGPLELLVLKADLVSEMQDALMDAMDARLSRA